MITAVQNALLDAWKDLFNVARMSTKPPTSNETPETIAAAAISAGMVIVASQIAELAAVRRTP
jgi:hypothetical protein